MLVHNFISIDLTKIYARSHTHARIRQQRKSRAYAVHNNKQQKQNTASVRYESYQHEFIAFGAVLKKRNYWKENLTQQIGNEAIKD